MTDRERLRELAEKATPGPWVSRGDAIHYSTSASGELLADHNFGGDDGVVRVNTVGRAGRWPHDRDYIAAASPDAILALLADLKAAEERVRVLRALVNEARHLVPTPTYVRRTHYKDDRRRTDWQAAALAATEEGARPYNCGGPMTGQPRPHDPCSCSGEGGRL